MKPILQWLVANRFTRLMRRTNGATTIFRTPDIEIVRAKFTTDTDWRVRWEKTATGFLDRLHWRILFFVPIDCTQVFTQFFIINPK